MGDPARPGFAFTVMNILQAGRRARDRQHLCATSQVINGFSGIFQLDQMFYFGDVSDSRQGCFVSKSQDVER